MKKSIKKIVSLLLVTSMLTGLLPVISQAEDETRTVYYSETFDSYDEGTTSLSGLSVVAGTNKYEVRKKYSASSEKNFWYKFDSNQVYIQRDFDNELSGKVVFSFDVKVDNTTMGRTRVYILTDDGTTLYLASFMKGILYLGNIAFSNYIPDKEYTITVAIDTDADTASYWVQGKLKQYKVDLGIDVKSIKYIRLHTSYLDMETAGGGTFDDIYVYEGEVHVDMDKEDTGSQQTPSSGISPSALANQVMKNSVAFRKDWQYARVDDEKKQIDTDDKVVPFDEGGMLHLPLRFIAENTGGSVNYDSSTQKVTLTTSAGNFSIDGTDLIKDGRVVAKDIVKNKNGRTFIPVDSIKEVFGVDSFYDAANGIAIVGDAPSKLSWDEHKKAISIILSSFMYADLSGEEIIAKIKANYPDKQHPRALVGGKTFEELKALIASDDFAGGMWSYLLSKADEYLTLPVTVYNIYDGTRLTSLCQQVQRRVKTLALAYNLTGDEKYAERAWMELYMASMFPDWNPNHYLDPAEMVAGFAIGYDWLYHWLDQTKRDILIKAIEEYSFKTVLQDYNNETRKRTWDWLRGSAAPNNWNIICNGATLFAAMVIGDEEAVADTVPQVLEGGLKWIKDGLTCFAPDGTCSEGPGYWQYQMPYYAFFQDGLARIVKDDMGYFDTPGYSSTVDSLQVTNGPTGVYNYSDSDNYDFVSSWAMLWLAQAYDRPELAQAEISKVSQTGRCEVEDLIFYSPEMMNVDSSSGKLDNILYGIGTASFRSDYSINALYVAIHGDSNQQGHFQRDNGGFIMDFLGERWFCDLGKADYYSQEGMKTAQLSYRVRTEGHNTLLINPEYDDCQTMNVSFPITKFVSEESGGYIVCDLTPSYSKWASSITRGLKLCDNRSAVIVQDEIKLLDTSEVYWQVHTQADIQISEDKKSAILSQDGKSIIIKLLSGDGFEFKQMAADPLPTSPQVYQLSNDHVKKLVAYNPQYLEGTLSVGIAPYTGEDYDFGAVTSIADWEISSHKSATADAIYVNGEALKGFSSDVAYYCMDIPFDASVPTVTADGATVIKQADNNNLVAVIEASSGDGSLVDKKYLVAFNRQTHIGNLEDKGYTRLKASKVYASAVPQSENHPDNVLDGSADTRWSAEQACWIEIDLGQITDIDAVGLTYMEGDARTQNLTIQISEDGENYTSVFAGKSCGTTLEFENYNLSGKKARYVRVNCNQTSTSSWNSITEFAIYKK